jgi:hypothetical protein
MTNALDDVFLRRDNKKVEKYKENRYITITVGIFIFFKSHYYHNRLEIKLLIAKSIFLN